MPSCKQTGQLQGNEGACEHRLGYPRISSKASVTRRLDKSTAVVFKTRPSLSATYAKTLLNEVSTPSGVYFQPHGRGRGEPSARAGGGGVGIHTSLHSPYFVCALSSNKQLQRRAPRPACFPVYTALLPVREGRARTAPRPREPGCGRRPGQSYKGASRRCVQEPPAHRPRPPKPASFSASRPPGLLRWAGAQAIIALRRRRGEHPRPEQPPTLTPPPKAGGTHCQTGRRGPHLRAPGRRCAGGDAEARAP